MNNAFLHARGGKEMVVVHNGNPHLNKTQLWHSGIETKEHYPGTS